MLRNKTKQPKQNKHTKKADSIVKKYYNSFLVIFRSC